MYSSLCVCVCFCVPLRDFGYVSRNPHTNQHQCHVFRCDIAARGVARALLDNHQHSKARSSHSRAPDSPGLRKSSEMIPSDPKSIPAFLQSFELLAQGGGVEAILGFSIIFCNLVMFVFEILSA